MFAQNLNDGVTCAGESLLEQDEQSLPGMPSLVNTIKTQAETETDITRAIQCFI